MIPPRLCATKIIGRCVVYHSQSRFQRLPMSKPLSAFSQGTDPTPVVLHGRIGIGRRRGHDACSHRNPSRRRAHSGCRLVGDHGASGCRSLPSTSCRGVHPSHGQQRGWELSVLDLVVLQMTDSTTGCSPWAGASDDSFGILHRILTSPWHPVGLTWKAPPSSP